MQKQEAIRLNKAILLAVFSHKDQIDKCGKPAILHPLAVMTSVDSATAKTVAILHDTLEDTNTTFEEIKNILDYHIANCVDILTRDSNETYKEYIYRISVYGDKFVKEVKIADLKHNLGRVNELGETGKSLQKRYEGALEMLGAK